MGLSHYSLVELGRPLTPQILNSPPRASQTEKELDPDGLKKESERERAMLALTSTLSKLIRRLEEKQSPELRKTHRNRRAAPKRPPPPPQPAGEGCQTRPDRRPGPSPLALLGTCALSLFLEHDSRSSQHL